MHESHDVESVLARLMPPALGESSQRDIELMIDELAGTDSARTPTRTGWIRYAAGGMAAALTLGLSAWWMFTPITPEMHLLADSDRVEEISYEGWQEDSAGNSLRALRVRFVGENRLFDSETGIVMRISEPREEFLLLPISSF
jgi:hypothetical protein